MNKKLYLIGLILFMVLISVGIYSIQTEKTNSFIEELLPTFLNSKRLPQSEEINFVWEGISKDENWKTIYLNHLGEDVDNQYGYWHNYSNSNVSFTYQLSDLQKLIGTINANGLKPYATYQIKIRGRPTCKYPDGNDELNEYLGYNGRWSCTDCDQTPIARNRNDAQYEANSYFKGDSSECIQSYISYDFFTTDLNGNISNKKVSSDTSYHVGRCGGGTCGTVSDIYLDYLDSNYPTIYFCADENVNGEIESGRGDCNGLSLDIDKYNLELAITEESFHQGNWSTVLTDADDISFEIGKTTQNNWTEINMTLSIEDNLDTFLFNWNEINYTFFNDNFLFSYNFNNNSEIGDNSTQVVDIMDNYNGTFNNTPTWIDGKYGKAIHLNESGDFINVGDVNLIGNQLTVSWWMKLDSNSGSTTSDNKVPVIIDWMIGTPYTDGTLLCYIKDDPSWSGGNFATNATLCTYHSSSGLNDLGTNFNDWYGSWHQVTYTLNGSDQRIYVDGELDNNNTGSGDIVSNSTNFVIGYKDWQYGTWLDGSIDEFKVYNRTISADEISKTYKSEFQKFNSTIYKFYMNITKLNDGDYEYYGWANDTFGNSSKSDIGIVRIDTTKPVITWEDPTPTDGDTQSEDNVYLNTTISDISRTSAFFDWNKSLVGYWPMDFYNSIGVFDNSTYDNFGTFYNISLDNKTEGKYGDAFYFSGNDYKSYIDCENNSELIISDTLTIDLWIKPQPNQEHCYDATSGWGNVGVLGNVDGADSTSTWSYQLRYGSADNCSLGLQLNTNDGDKWVTLGYNLSTETWSHIVVTFNGTDEKIYVNGILKDTNTFALTTIKTSPNNKILLGVAGWGSSNTYYEGEIDEVKIFNRLLSNEEIKASYDNSLYRLYHNFTGLSNETYNYSAYVIDIVGNLEITNERKITINLGEGDTCTCAGLNENWEINMSDYCNITSDCNLGTGKLSFTGIGITKINSTINTTNLGDPGSNGILKILSNCIIWIKGT